MTWYMKDRDQPAPTSDSALDVSVRLSDVELDALEYHGCSSGTSTPQLVRNGIVRATSELRQRRAADAAIAAVIAAAESWYDNGPVNAGIGAAVAAYREAMRGNAKVSQ